MTTTKKKYTKQISEYIDELPENVIPINSYVSCCNGILEFNRYWYDPINSRIIMKPKRGNKFKIVKPMNDKYHDRVFVTLFDVNNRQNWVNYEKLLNQINNS